MLPKVLLSSLSSTIIGSNQIIATVRISIRINISWGKSDGCIPRFKMGGILSNVVEIQKDAPQNDSIRKLTTQGSKLCLGIRLLTEKFFNEFSVA